MTWLDSMGYNKTGLSYDGSGDDGCPWNWKTGYPSNDNQDTVRAAQRRVRRHPPRASAGSVRATAA